MDNTNNVLSLFDITIKEEFNLSEVDGTGFTYNPYHFDDKMNLRDKDDEKRNNFIGGLITGEFKIKKIKKFIEPIFCNVGDFYSYVNSQGNRKNTEFVGNVEDYYCRKMGNMFPIDSDISANQRQNIVNLMISK